MSAQKSPRSGVLSGAAGLVGFSALAGLLVTVMVTPAVAITGVTASSTIGIFDSLPEYIEIGQQPERNTIYAQYSGEGNVGGYQEIARIYKQNREEVPFEEISQFALDAAVAGEDERFYTHGGVDVQSVIRTALDNFVAGGIEGGSSTLSMQLVKQIFVQEALELPTEEEREAAYEEATATEYDRKLKEMKLAIGLEKKYTKKEILTAYLNIAFFGDNTYGIQAASQRYFSKDAKDLTLAEAAALIAIVQYPETRDLSTPDNYPANEARRDVILQSMERLGMVTQEQYQEAYDTLYDENFVKPSTPSNGCMGADRHAKWFCDYVVKNVKNFEFLGADEAERQANWDRGGYQLYTTLDMDVQVNAQMRMWDYVNYNETAMNLGGASTSVEVGTGRVLTMTENKEYNNTLEGGGSATTAVNFNANLEYGASSGFPGGSTYKLFTLLAWLDAGKGLYERVSGDARTENMAKFQDSCNGPYGGPYQFRNDGGQSPGAVDIISATSGSINGAFLTMAMQLDQCKIAEMAKNVGVERADGDPLTTQPSAVLGTNEITPLGMAGAYATVASGGKYCKPIVVDRAIGPDGAELPGQAQECRQALDPEVAAAAAGALRAVMTGGTGSASNPGDGIPIIGKTGTTNSAEHTWIVTSTTRVATAVWVGNIVGQDPLYNYEWMGYAGNQLRHPVMAATMAVIDSKYGGGEFPAIPDRFMKGSSLAVPDVRGQTPDAAKALLEGLGFGYKDGGVVDSDVEAGKVATTDPPPGATSAVGIVVTVYTSNGALKGVPDVAGETVEGARSILQGAGFTNINERCQRLPSSTQPNDPRVDRVSSSNPPAGTVIRPGDPITLTVTKLSC
ncbi:membrane peptidoglycan carboxypeptidase [Microbacteriaceae bacterium SG_E_30_P1]|uniref:Membrane peptidoglycan carboxypeptidase n=1 Tax=Antiquaquibacter oligotrophicus TaxID=2880260 RepID=A0ABT6KPC8_9MICO|nr:transglycosylase domain-containing protein [Antiquaquibacter oligotrophicus]MDH6181846.1 membrane peptidoglycan carboxypeptidase [Antiquaquibacter oligotrophicus]UDF12477.1 transglycosylase domain-containing protein [Antiquaquibacter oligotrophicus]